METTTMIDSATRNAIARAVRQAQVEAAEMYGERWVTAAELCRSVTMITKDWLETYGWKLPRERISVTGDDGKRRVSRWGYPLHRIQRMLHEGKLRDM